MPEALLTAALMAIAGVALLLYPQWVRNLTQAANQRHAARIAELEAGAPEVYFEELRDLKVYPPTRPRTWRLIGKSESGQVH